MARDSYTYLIQQRQGSKWVAIAGPYTSWQSAALEMFNLLTQDYDPPLRVLRSDGGIIVQAP